MPVEIVVPQVGEAVAEITLLHWFKREGDPVRRGEALFEVDTDKAVVEVEAFCDGAVSRILVPAGNAVMPQQAVALLATMEELAATQSTGGPNAFQGPAALTTNPAPLARHTAPTGTDARSVPASPKARRLAKELGIDLTMVVGTGVDGLIIAEDVQRAATAHAEPATRDPVPMAQPPDSKLRRAIAIRTQASQQMVPHFYLMVDADMTEAQRLRVYCREQLSWERAPTYTDLMVRACALAVSNLPEVNVAYTDVGLTRRTTIDIGIAVSVDAGLLVPVLVECDRLSLREISSEVRRLAEQARVGRLPLTSEPHKSLVVSNLGMHGVDAFAAIIDMPDPMILAVGRVAERVVPVNGQPMVRPMCTLVLSVDHRALDGVQGARFLTRVKAYLEHATELVDTAT